MRASYSLENRYIVTFINVFKDMFLDILNIAFKVILRFSFSVPDSPHEPDPEPYEPMPPRLIPLDEVHTTSMPSPSLTRSQGISLGQYCELANILDILICKSSTLAYFLSFLCLFDDPGLHDGGGQLHGNR